MKERKEGEEKKSVTAIWFFGGLVFLVLKKTIKVTKKVMKNWVRRSGIEKGRTRGATLINSKKEEE